MGSSLQEVAPISYAFVGSWFLDRYLDRFGEALNLAAGRVLSEEGVSASVPRSGIEDGADTAGSDQEPLIGSPSSSAASPSSQLNRRQHSTKSGPYTLVRARNVGMTAILLYVREPKRVRKVEGAECGFGMAEMGNKGAVGLRVTWDSSRGSETERRTGKTTELTFVAAHLAAMEWNVHKRNADWRAIVEGLIFEDPKHLLSSATEGPSLTEEEDPSSDAAPLLPVSDPNTSQQLAKLHSHTIYSPTSYFFIAGDLNYRISSTAPTPDDIFPSVTPTPEDPHYSQFFARDQLTQERLAGRTLHGLSEAEVKFPPTYKVVVTNPDSPQGGEEEGVTWRFARHRWPAWCDRVLWLDVPPWVNSSSRDKKKIVTKAYDALPVVRTSDHRAVFWRGEVPLLSTEELAPPPPPSSIASTSSAAEGLRSRGIGHHEQHREWEDDPRVKLPFTVDVHAWERRAAARQRELVVGLTALLWSTREGALVLSTMVALGLGGWWLFWG